MRRFAKIENGLVVDVYEADGDWPLADVPVVEIPNGLPVGPGSAYVDGAFITPTQSPAGPPSVVDMAQARLALLQSGLYGTVQAAVAAMPGAAGDAARIEWEFRATVRRDSPLVASLSAALGLTSQQLDDLFTLAGTL